MKKYFEDAGAPIFHGDVLECVGGMEDNSFDGCLTDPPYGLGFMGHGWDRGVPPAEVWQEVLRVLKPGAFLLAFGGTRTHHRLMCAIEDAGFEIRDCVMWMYGSGFPKSMNLGQAIDKAGLSQPDHLLARKDMARDIKRCREARSISRAEMATWFPYKEVTKNWERLDQGFRVPAEFDYQVLVGRIGLDEKWRCMVRAEDKRLKRDSVKADRRNDETVYGLAHNGCEYEATTDAAKLWAGFGTALKPAWEPIIVAMKPCDGTFAGNALKWGVAGMNIDGSRIGNGSDKTDGGCAVVSRIHDGGITKRSPVDFSIGRFPANVILDEEAGAALDLQTGTLTSGTWDGNRTQPKTKQVFGSFAIQTERGTHGSEGGASRFFYCAKASASERDGNTHPTVKPVKLTEYLAKLILPPGGRERRLLVPFSGSGSEVVGAMSAGWESVTGIEREENYVKIARDRVASRSATQDSLFGSSL